MLFRSPVHLPRHVLPPHQQPASHLPGVCWCTCHRLPSALSSLADFKPVAAIPPLLYCRTSIRTHLCSSLLPGCGSAGLWSVCGCPQPECDRSHLDTEPLSCPTVEGYLKGDWMNTGKQSRRSETLVYICW